MEFHRRLDFLLLRELQLARHKMMGIIIHRERTRRIMRSCSCCCRSSCSCSFSDSEIRVRLCSRDRLKMINLWDFLRIDLFTSNLTEYLLDSLFKTLNLSTNFWIHVTRSPLEVIYLFIHFLVTFSVISRIHWNASFFFF